MDLKLLRLYFYNHSKSKSWIISRVFLPKKDKKGKLTHIIIDTQIHNNTMRPVLEEMLNKQREAFYRDFENGITIEEARQRMYEPIDKLFENKE